MPQPMNVPRQMAGEDAAADAPEGELRTRGRLARGITRYALAALIVAGAVAVSSLVTVGAGQAVVVTRLGNPERVLTHQGLGLKLPAPIEGTIDVDLRLHSTSSGLQDVGTRDGLRVLLQAFLVWRVSDDPARILRFLRAADNNPDEAARQLRSFIASALQVTASNYALADLVNTDAKKVRLAAFEQQLHDSIAAQALDIYGVDIQEVGVERFSLPAETLAATVARMRAEREIVAAERSAEGLRVAAKIRSDAARDSRVTAAQARAEAAEIEAASRQKAARIYADSYTRDPQLYVLLRSLDTMDAVIGPRTHLVLRADAAPFNVLVQSPGAPATLDASQMGSLAARLREAGQ